MCSNKYLKSTISAMLIKVKGTTYSIGYRKAKTGCSRTRDGLDRRL